MLVVCKEYASQRISVNTLAVPCVYVYELALIIILGFFCQLTYIVCRVVVERAV